MYAQRGAAQYRSVRSHGLVADASPARLVQIMFEQILAQLATAQGCMERIENNLPLNDVVTKGKSLGKAIRLIDQLNNTLDMERGQKIAENLRALYVYMLARLTLANVSNDAKIVAEVMSLVQKIKTGWDQIVEPR
ncbi:MAG TPA: flagellar export chaperone FliS [Steroidobacteraceae bacterium]|nr:flagellar export chaperone FliS [Steroidobacteraceae bacterium]